MKQLRKEETKAILGGATHYHWVCSVNNFWSVSYSTSAKAGAAADKHRDTYPSHKYKTYVQSCTGKTCS